MITLACGPYINVDGVSLWVSITVFLLFKPLAYFGFIQAFRYRVVGPVPMTYRRAMLLTVVRAGLGILIFAIGAGLVVLTGSDAVLAWSWVYLYLSRAGAWYGVGRWGAGLRGRRLVGWTITGTMINAAFDFAVLFGVFGGWIFPVGVLVFLCVFIGVLDRVGRREALRLGFPSDAACRKCRYDLTGNLSGRCPECSALVTEAISS